MGPVILILALAGLIWFGVFLRHTSTLSFNPVIAGAVVVLIAASVFGPEFFAIASGPIPITIDRLLLGGLLVIFASRIYLGLERIEDFNRTDVLIFSLLGYMMISTFTHDWSYFKKLPLSRLLFFYMLPISLYVVVRNSKINVKELRIITYGMIGFGLYLTLTAIAEVKGLTGFVFPGYISDALQQEFFGRARGPFMNPVSNGIVMTIAFSCLLFCWPKSSDRTKFLIILALPIFLIGIYATKTRSVWLGMILIGAFGTLYLSPRHLRGGLVVCGVLGGMILALVFSDNVSSFKRDKFVTEAEMKQSASLRPLFAVVAVRMFRDRPIMGHGFGQYRQAKMPYLQDPTGKYELIRTKTYYQHNVFLAYLTELGLIGLGLLLMLLLDMTIMGVAIWRNRKRHLLARQYGLLMLFVIIIFFTNGMFHDVTIAPMVNMFLFFFAGVIANLSANKHATEMTDEELALYYQKVHKNSNKQRRINGSQLPAT